MSHCRISVVKNLGSKSFRRILRRALPLLVVGLLLLISVSNSFSQTTDSEIAAIDSNAQPLTFLFAGLEGFIPQRQGYRLNYSTSFAGLPIELSGGFLFPIVDAARMSVTVRYVNRTANFVSGSAISVLSIEPGVRVYLERQRKNDIRIFAGADALFAEADVSGVYDVSTDGTISSTQSTSKNYLDLGMGFDLGFAYPLSNTSGLDATVHAAIYLGSPLAHGGIGNIGGISIGLLYRYGF